MNDPTHVHGFSDSHVFVGNYKSLWICDECKATVLEQERKTDARIKHREWHALIAGL